MIIQHLFKILTKKEGYGQCREYVKIDSLDGNFKKVLAILDKLYNKGAETIQIEDLKTLLIAEYPSLKEHDKEALFGALVSVYNIPDNSIAGKEVVELYLKEQMAAKIFMLGTAWLNNPSRFNINKLKKICDDYGNNEGDVDEDGSLREFTVDELFKAEDDDAGYSFGLPELDKLVGKLKYGGGILGLIFAPTDTGKSAFLHTIATHLASQCKVLMINNEERDTKVNLRARLCWTKMTKQEAMGNKKEFIRRWDMIDKNYVHRDISSPTIADIKRYIKKDKPKVIFIDQAPGVVTKQSGDRLDQKLKHIFKELRDVCKEFGVTIFGVTQADAKAEHVEWLQKWHVADCKVGIQGELDIQIGLKCPNDGNFINVSICKGKETGNKGGRTVLELNRDISRMFQVN